MKNILKDKAILVVGGTGTIGEKIVQILLQYDPKVIRIYSRDEYKQFIMQNNYNGDHRLRFLIGDVRDYERLSRACKGVDIIFNLAAMKHVPACEYDPFEAVKTNVLGTQNVIQAAMENNIEKVVFTSSDKAISPTNSMGATKLLAERLFISAESFKGKARTVFSVVRFGNVMGSRGSVIPLFEQQILEKRKITLTNGEMSRFMMTVTDAAELTVKSVFTAKGGEIFVLKMPIVRLKDLGEAIIEMVCSKYGISTEEIAIENIGLRPGEKMYEELMTEEESVNAYELEDMFIILPTFNKDGNYGEYGKYKKAEIDKYSSHNGQQISKNEIKKLLLKENLI